MKETLSEIEKYVLAILARTRALRLDGLLRYRGIKYAKKPDALRKLLERMCEKGLLAKTAMPAGSQLFRLSHKGSKLVGAPSAWAAAPSSGVIS